MSHWALLTMEFLRRFPEQLRVHTPHSQEGSQRRHKDVTISTWHSVLSAPICCVSIVIPIQNQKNSGESLNIHSQLSAALFRASPHQLAVRETHSCLVPESEEIDQMLKKVCYNSMLFWLQWHHFLKKLFNHRMGFSPTSISMDWSPPVTYLKRAGCQVASPLERTQIARDDGPSHTWVY